MSPCHREHFTRGLLFAWAGDSGLLPALLPPLFLPQVSPLSSPVFSPNCFAGVQRDSLSNSNFIIFCSAVFGGRVSGGRTNEPRIKIIKIPRFLVSVNLGQ